MKSKENNISNYMNRNFFISIKQVYKYLKREKENVFTRKLRKNNRTRSKVIKYKLKLASYKNKLLIKQVSLKEQKVILGNINILLEQGYSINESITYINITNKKYIYEQLLEGNLFSSILRDIGFDKNILLILEILESSGNICEGINRSHTLLTKKIENKSNILDKLKYPLLLLIFLIIALLFISTFLLPMFLKVYSNFNIQIEGTFLILIKVIINLPKILFIIFLILIIMLVYYKVQEDNDKLNIIFKNKIIQKQYYKNYNNIFLINLYSILQSGISLKEAFEILCTQEYNFFLRHESKKIYKQLCLGEDLWSVLQKRKIYNENTILAIKEGVESSTLLESLNNLILIEELKVKRKYEKLIMLIQPLIYLVFGLTIILLYMAIFIPMFKIMDAL